MTEDLAIKYRKRSITVTDTGEEGPARYIITIYGYPKAYAANLEEMEQELEKLYERERVRLSYKKA